METVEIFMAAKEKIKKSQEHQAKSYNNRQIVTG